MPPLETAKRLTAESVRIVAKADLIFLNSQTLTVRSSDPETTLSSRAKTVDVTLLKLSIIKLFFFKAYQLNVIFILLCMALENRYCIYSFTEIPQSKCRIS